MRGGVSVLWGDSDRGELRPLPGPLSHKLLLSQLNSKDGYPYPCPGCLLVLAEHPSWYQRFCGQVRVAPVVSIYESVLGNILSQSFLIRGASPVFTGAH